VPAERGTPWRKLRISSRRPQSGYLRDLADTQTINHDKKGSWKAPLWQALTEAGLPLSWVSEQYGGSGASLAEGFSVLSAAGRFAIGVPLAETMLGRMAAVASKNRFAQGEMTVAPTGPKDRVTVEADGTLSGRARGVPSLGMPNTSRYWRTDARLSIALVEAGCVPNRDGLNLGGGQQRHGDAQPRRSRGHCARATRLRSNLAAPDGRRGAKLQIAGALETTLDITVRYSNERVAFEKKISKFQAVQHNLAKLAGESAAALAAATSAADTLASGGAVR